jgi:CHASE3 domain sensor protein
MIEVEETRPSFGSGDMKLLTRQRLIVFLPVLVAIVVSSAISFGYNQLLRSYRVAVEHTFRVITAIDQLQLKLQDAETGQRGFVITGDESYLSPFAEGSASIVQTIAEIRKLAEDNAAQIARLSRLHELTTAKLDELRSTIDARRTAGFAAAQARILEHSGKQLMDRMRSVAGEMRASELALLEARASNARFAERMMIGVALACVLLSIAGRLVAAYLERREAET